MRGRLTSHRLRGLPGRRRAARGCYRSGIVRRRIQHVAPERRGRREDLRPSPAPTCRSGGRPRSSAVFSAALIAVRALFAPALCTAVCDLGLRLGERRRRPLGDLDQEVVAVRPTIGLETVLRGRFSKVRSGRQRRGDPVEDVAPLWSTAGRLGRDLRERCARRHLGRGGLRRRLSLVYSATVKQAVSKAAMRLEVVLQVSGAWSRRRPRVPRTRSPSRRTAGCRSTNEVGMVAGRWPR